MDRADHLEWQGPDLRIDSARTTGRRAVRHQGTDDAVEGDLESDLLDRVAG